MKFPSRRKPLAQIICFGFAGFLAGSTAIEALAQSAAPLRVDPVLLGLPPIKPEEAPALARPPVSPPAAVEKTRAEIKPVEAPVVETRPVKSEPEPGRPAETGGVAPPVSSSAAPVPVPAIVVPSPRPARQVEAVVQKPVPVSTVQGQGPRPVAQQTYPVAAPGLSSSSVAPLRVDPALLGLPTDSMTGGTPSPGRTQVALAPLSRKPVNDG